MDTFNEAEKILAAQLPCWPLCTGLFEMLKRQYEHYQHLSQHPDPRIQAMAPDALKMARQLGRDFFLNISTGAVEVDEDRLKRFVKRNRSYSI